MDPIRFLNAGESHGPGLTLIIEGFPAGLLVDVEAINDDLARRQKSFGSGGRMRIEKDRVTVRSGVMAGRTTGAPIAMVVDNKDFKNWQDKNIAPITSPRPGHADLTGALKYDYDDFRLSLERASARETTLRVAMGALCKQLLEAVGVSIGGFVQQICAAKVEVNDDDTELESLAKLALQNDLSCPVADEKQLEMLRDEIKSVAKDKDTVGGIFEVFALGLPPGLGSHVHWDRRLDGKIAQAMLSIQAMKGVEIGNAFEHATSRGTRVHDAMALDGQDITRPTNRAGGLEGGMTNGEALRVRVAMKPIATTLTPLPSIDFSTGKESVTTYERSDVCALPRAVVIGEAMLAFVLANALLEKVGGDTLGEIVERSARLRGNTMDALNLHGRDWRFDGADVDDANVEEEVGGKS
ncbi:MAG: chorismate synthase [Deltaproteobacteria bacterium]|nr:chorismate synthase [Deltaproteobacteria bacterium]